MLRGSAEHIAAGSNYLHRPTRPATISSMHIRPAEPPDLGQLFSMQRAAFVDEAFLYGTPEVPALLDTRDDLQARLAASSTWVSVDNDRLIGAISVRTWREPGPDIERLMVVPDRRGEGVATDLVRCVETYLVQTGCTAVQLVVGGIAVDNQRLYQRLGFVATSSTMLDGYPSVEVITMTKQLRTNT